MPRYLPPTTLPSLSRSLNVLPRSIVSGAKLSGLIADRDQPAIVRATAIALLAEQPEQATPEILQSAIRGDEPLVQLAALGFPLAGDDKYGDFAWNRALAKGGLKRMFLHAWKLDFAHPVTGEPMALESPLPADLARFVASLDRTPADDA